ncbi:MAG TPA: hypothetical protein V6D07_18575 [Trichocoleus sp.]
MATIQVSCWTPQQQELFESLLKKAGIELQERPEDWRSGGEDEEPFAIMQSESPLIHNWFEVDKPEAQSLIVQTAKRVTFEATLCFIEDGLIEPQIKLFEPFIHIE